MNEKKQKLIDLIQEIRKLTGWDVALDDQPGHAEVQGVILGTTAFLDRVDYACKKAAERKPGRQ